MGNIGVTVTTLALLASMFSLVNAVSFHYQPRCVPEAPEKVLLEHDTVDKPMQITVTPEVGDAQDALTGSGSEYTSSASFSFLIKVNPSWVGLEDHFTLRRLCLDTRGARNMTVTYITVPGAGIFETEDIDPEYLADWTTVCFTQPTMIETIELTFDPCENCVTEVKTLMSKSCHVPLTP